MLLSVKKKKKKEEHDSDILRFKRSTYLDIHLHSRELLALIAISSCFKARLFRQMKQAIPCIWGICCD